MCTFLERIRDLRPTLKKSGFVHIPWWNTLTLTYIFWCFVPSIKRTQVVCIYTLITGSVHLALLGQAISALLGQSISALLDHLVVVLLEQKVVKATKAVIPPPSPPLLIDRVLEAPTLKHCSAKPPINPHYFIGQHGASIKSSLSHWTAI